MNMQELLTYVEELTFKTSMFGYDKDEVDIQLDKICDEAEAIILAKEKEIEELKKESKTALGIAAAATGKTMEELEKDTQEDIVETEEQPEEAKNPEEGIHIQEEGSETVTTESHHKLVCHMDYIRHLSPSKATDVIYPTKLRGDKE